MATTAATAKQWDLRPLARWRLAEVDDEASPLVHTVNARAVSLPVGPLRDVRRGYEDSWNIVRVGYGADNASLDGNALTVSYPKGSINPSSAKKGAPLGGLGFYAAPTTIFPARDVELSYQIRFKSNFKPQRGGKLPGLFISKGSAATARGGSGGSHNDTTASVRFMWRRDMDAEAYVYSTSARTQRSYTELPGIILNPRSGDSLWRGFTKFKPHGWNTLRMRVRLNSRPGRADGLLAIQVNDSFESIDDVLWTRDDDVAISAVFFSTFYGGNTQAWASPTHTGIEFKDFLVTRWDELDLPVAGGPKGDLREEDLDEDGSEDEEDGEEEDDEPILQPINALQPLALDLPTAALRRGVMSGALPPWNIVRTGYGAENASANRRSLTVRYPKGSVSPSAVSRGAPLGGLGFYASPAAIFPARDVELSYKVRFANNFQPARGGKLPGLFITQGSAAKARGGSGGSQTDTTSSVRFMWRQDLQAEAYVYSVAARSQSKYRDLPGSHLNLEFGDSLWRGGAKFRARGWNSLRVRVRMNSEPGKPDGLLEIQVNNDKFSFDEMLWTNARGVAVTALFFSTFYGGSSDDWASPTHTSIQFKDFSLVRLSV